MILSLFLSLRLVVWLLAARLLGEHTNQSEKEANFVIPQRDGLGYRKLHKPKGG